MDVFHKLCWPEPNFNCAKLQQREQDAQQLVCVCSVYPGVQVCLFVPACVSARVGVPALCRRQCLLLQVPVSALAGASVCSYRSQCLLLQVSVSALAVASACCCRCQCLLLQVPVSALAGVSICSCSSQCLLLQVPVSALAGLSVCSCRCQCMRKLLPQIF